MCIRQGRKSACGDAKDTDQWSTDLGSRLDSAILFLPEFGQANSPCQVLVVSYFKGFISTMIFYISLVFLQFFIVNLHWMSLAHKDPWLSLLRKRYFIKIKVLGFLVFCLLFIAFSLEFYTNIIMTLLFFNHFDWGILTHWEYQQGTALLYK